MPVSSIFKQKSIFEQNSILKNSFEKHIAATSTFENQTYFNGRKQREKKRENERENERERENWENNSINCQKMNFSEKKGVGHVSRSAWTKAPCLPCFCLLNVFLASFFGKWGLICYSANELTENSIKKVWRRILSQNPQFSIRAAKCIIESFFGGEQDQPDTGKKKEISDYIFR